MAYVRIGRFHTQPGMGDEVRDIYTREAIPAIRASDGNVSATLLEDETEPGSFMAVTIWADVEAAERYDRSGKAAQMVATVRHAFAGPPELSTWTAWGIN